MEPEEIIEAYKQNKDEEIVGSFEHLSLLNLTPEQGGMVAWAHSNVLNRAKGLRREEIVQRHRDIVDMAKYVFDKTDNNGIKSSMHKLAVLHEDHLVELGELKENDRDPDVIWMAIKLDPSNTDIYNVLGARLNRAGRFAEAKAVLEDGIAQARGRFDPNDPECFKQIRYIGSATRNLAISVKELGDVAMGITLTHLAEQLWLDSEAGGWSTATHRQGIAKMRAEWEKLLPKKA